MGKLWLFIVAAVSVCVLFQSVSAQQLEKDKRELVESKTLKNELQKVVQELLEAARAGKFTKKQTNKLGKTTTYIPPLFGPGESKKGLPDKEITPEKLTAALIQHFRKSDPKFLRVTPEVEKHWKADKFDDVAARKRIMKASDLFDKFSIRLPKMHERLIRKARTDSGARLQLTAHILDAYVAQIVQGLKGKSKDEK